MKNPNAMHIVVIAANKLPMTMILFLPYLVNKYDTTKGPIHFYRLIMTGKMDLSEGMA